MRDHPDFRTDNVVQLKLHQTNTENPVDFPSSKPGQPEQIKAWIIWRDLFEDVQEICVGTRKDAESKARTPDLVEGPYEFTIAIKG